MNTLSTLLICGLQVTLVATVGLLISLIARRWLRTSATVPLAATLAAVVLLTVCAFSSWPSWLQGASSQKTGSGLLNVTLPEFATDPAMAPYVEHLTPMPWGGYVTMPRWVDSILYGIPSDDDAPWKNYSAEESGVSARWTGANWLYLFIGAAILFGLIRVIGGLWAVRLFVRTSRPLKSPELLEQVDLLRAEMGCTPPVEIRECPHLATAATVGWRHPVILLSESWQTWTETQLRSVLAHEIAHITRGDFLSTIAAQVGVVLHFYHPLVHWLANRLRLEQELAADALAAQVVGGSRAYLNAIGELALKQTEEPVGWPAHSFLPTRRTFLRRIEMLRDLKFLSGSAPRLVRWATLASVAAVTLVAIGLRPPGGETAPSSVSAQEKPKAVVPRGVVLGADPPVSRSAEGIPAGLGNAPVVATTEALNPLYIPADAFFVIAARPEVLNQQWQTMQAAKLIPDIFENPFDQIAGCQHMSVSFSLLPNITQGQGEPLHGVCLTFANREARDAAVRKTALPTRNMDPGQPAEPDWKKTKLLLFEYEVNTVENAARFMPDDRTLIFASINVIEQMILTGSKSASPLTQTTSWKAAANGSVALAIDAVGLQKLMAQATPNPIVGMFSPMWDSAVSHTLGLTVGDKTQLTLTSLSKDAAGTQKVEAIHKAGVTMLSNMLSQAKSSPDPNMKKIVDGLLPILEGHKLTTQGNETTLTCEADLSGVLALLAQPLSQARAAAQRAQQQNNLRQIMLAMHNYHDSRGQFPPAVVIDKASGVPHSWRVEILPYVEEANLYHAYKMNEPWDSENNKKVLAQMPSVFRHPSQPANSTSTAFIAAYGKGLVFEENPTEGTKIGEITDGTSNTIAVYETKTDIPWTKPEDITIDLTQDKLPEFGGFEEGVFLVGLCDGSVKFISRSIDIGLLKKLFTKAGGEVTEGF